MNGKKSLIVATIYIIAIAVIAVLMLSLMTSCSRASAYTEPAPSGTQDNSITKQVLETIVYSDQEQAVAISDLLNETHDELALDAISVRADIAGKHSASHDKSALANVYGTTANDNSTSAEEAVREPLDVISPEGDIPIDEMKPATISVNGDIVAFTDSFESTSAPASGAGLWMGSDSTTDGTWGYFIGHNPGDFTCVMTLSAGDPITVCDKDGNTRIYSVIDGFDVPDTTYWEDIEGKVSGYGESVILQTCCGDGAHYRVVVAR